MKTLNLTIDIPPNREVKIQLPADIPPGPTEILVVIASQETSAPMPTLGDLLKSEFFGMWADRTDITDSVEFARQLRQQAWSRSTDDDST